MPDIIVTLKEGSDAREFISRPGSGISVVNMRVIADRIFVIPMRNVTDDYLDMLQEIPEVVDITLVCRDRTTSEPDWEYMLATYNRIASDVATLGRLITGGKPKEIET